MPNAAIRALNRLVRYAATVRVGSKNPRYTGLLKPFDGIHAEIENPNACSNNERS